MSSSSNKFELKTLTRLKSAFGQFEAHFQTNFNQKHKIRAYFPSKLNKKVQIAFNRPSADLGLIS
jgi:hypothetical protein